MTHRTTFALDDITIQRIKGLAKRWNVSQAEVVRSAICMAESKASKPDPVLLLQQLHAKGGGMSAEAAKSYLAEVRQGRKQWRGK